MVDTPGMILAAVVTAPPRAPAGVAASPSPPPLTEADRGRRDVPGDQRFHAVDVPGGPGDRGADGAGVRLQAGLLNN